MNKTRLFDLEGQVMVWPGLAVWVQHSKHQKKTINWLSLLRETELCDRCCLSVCLPVIMFVSRITHERVYRHRPNMESMGKGWLHFGV